MKSSFQLILLFVLLHSCPTWAQNPVKLKEQVEKYYALGQPEKIYLHLNTNALICGESLHFKVYCRKASNHKPSSLSRLAYVELLDSNNTPVLQSKILLSEGSGSGEFFLPANIPSANYRIVAYTNWMKNQGAAAFYQDWISIINPFLPLEVPKPNDVREQGVQIFMEGNRLIQGLNNRLYYVIDPSSVIRFRPEAYLRNQSGDTLQVLKHGANGMGGFDFIPQAGPYFLAFISQNGKTTQYPLPPARKDGVCIGIDDTPAGYSLNLQSSNTGKYYLLVHQKGQVILEKPFSLSPQMSNWLLSHQQLPTGVSWLSLFNAQQEVIWERPIFKEAPSTGPLLQLLAKPEIITNRQAVRLTWTFSPELDSAEILDLSVSVRKKTPYTLLARQQVGHYFGETLNSLAPKGRFSSNIQKKLREIWLAQHLTLPLNWKKTLSPAFKNVQYLPELRGDLLSGTLLQQGRPIPGLITTLSVPGKEYHFMVDKTDSLGRFYFNSNQLPENCQLLLQAPSLNKEGYQITLDDEFWPQHLPSPSKPLNLGLEWRDYLADLSMQVQIENAYYRQKQNLNLQNKIYRPFYGEAEEFYRLDDYTRFPNLTDVIREYVKSVSVRPRNEVFPLKVRDQLDGLPFKRAPLVLLDGIPISEVDTLLTYEATQIQSIGIYNQYYYYGPLECEGIIDFQTYDGDYNNYPLPEAVSTLPYVGVQPQQAIFQPDYVQESEENSRTPDFRQQLYWNPFLRSEARKLKPIDFFTGDDTGTYEVVLEGLTQSGQVIYFQSEFQVGDTP